MVKWEASFNPSHDQAGKVKDIEGEHFPKYYGKQTLKNIVIIDNQRNIYLHMIGEPIFEN